MASLPQRRVLAPIAALLALVGHALTPAASIAAPVTSTPKQRSAAASSAVAQIGRPYVYGAAGPRSFDCSGLVGFAYAAAGHPLRSRASFGMWNEGAHIRRSALRRGDIVFTWDRNHGHVGVYLGRNRYVHAPHTGQLVQSAPLPAGAGFVGAVRP